MSQIIYNVINITALIHISLKGQCHEIFDHFFGLKDSTEAPNEQAKTGFARIFYHKVRKSCVHVL